MRYFEKQSTIKMEDGKYVVYTESGKKFGTYDTISSASKRLKRMHMFKRYKEDADRDRRFN